MVLESGLPSSKNRKIIGKVVNSPSRQTLAKQEFSTTMNYYNIPEMDNDKGTLWRELIGIFLISFAVLLFEITITKIAEYSLWSNYAFLVISIAMFGLGLSGVILTRWPDILKVDNGLFFGGNALCCALTIWLGFLAFNNFPVHLPDAPDGWVKEIVNLSALFLTLSLPFLFFGFIISGLFEKKGDRAGIYYCVDLVGAGLGCLALMALIQYIAPQGLVLLSVLLAVITVPLFFFSSRYCNRFLTVLMSFMVLGAMAAGVYWIPKASTMLPLEVHAQKRTYKRDLHGGKIEATNWSALSRVDVAPLQKNAKRVWISGGVNESSIIKFDGDYEAIRAKRDENLIRAAQIIHYQAFPFVMKNDPTVCMIGTSGGADSLYALSLGAKHVVGVEMDPGVASMVLEKYHDYAGGLFTDGEYSEMVIDEGRSYLRRTERKFDIIQQINNFTPIAFMNGALNLSETYLLTVESFQDFYDHLTDDGMLSISRYGSIRMLSNGVEMFRRMGVPPEEYAKHFLVVEGPVPVIPTFIMKKSAFTREEIEKFEQWYYSYGKRRSILYAPFIESPENLYSLIATAEDPTDLYTLGAFNFEPTTDNKPFFNHMKTIGLKDGDRNSLALLPDEVKHIEPRGVIDNRIPKGDVPPVAVLLIAFALSSVFFGLPMFSKSELRASLRSERKALAYFACLGMGFIFVEICLIQRFVLFLGQPVYSISIVLFSILISAGLGSLVSNRFAPSKRNIICLLLTVSVIILIMHFTIPLLSAMFIGYSLFARMAIALGFLSFAGFFMGMPMPFAIRFLKENRRSIISWGWATNGYFSVLGSALTILIATNFGFNTVFYLAAILYCIAPFFLVRDPA